MSWWIPTTSAADLSESMRRLTGSQFCRFVCDERHKSCGVIPNFFTSCGCPGSNAADRKGRRRNGRFESVRGRRSASHRHGRQARVMAGRAAHHALEGRAERAFRLYTLASGRRRHGFAARQAASGEQHPPARKIFDRSIADQLPKSRRETGSRHADFEGQRRHRPTPRWLAMDRRDRRPDVLVGERKQPADARLSSRCRRSAWTKIMVASCWTIRKPPGLGSTSSCRIRSMAQSNVARSDLAPQMDDWRQHAEQHVRLRPGELEMAAKHRDPAAVVQPDQRALAGAEKVAFPILGRRAGSLATRNGAPCGSRRQSPRLKSAASPAPSTASQHSARRHGIAFDSVIGIEADRPVAAASKPPTR